MTKTLDERADELLDLLKKPGLTAAERGELEEKLKLIHVERTRRSSEQ